MSGHETFLHWLTNDGLGWIFILWWMGVLGAGGAWWRKMVKRRSEAAEVRHRRRVELARAQAASPTSRPAATSPASRPPARRR